MRSQSGLADIETYELINLDVVTVSPLNNLNRFAAIFEDVGEKVDARGTEDDLESRQ